MDTTTFQVVYPYMAIGGEKEDEAAQRRMIAAELQQVVRLVEFFHPGEDVEQEIPPSVSIRQLDLKEYPEEISIWRDFKKDFHFLVFQFHLKLGPWFGTMGIEKDDPKFGEDWLAHHRKNHIRNGLFRAFQPKVFELCFLSQIARPGSLPLHECRYFIDDDLQSTKGKSIDSMQREIRTQSRKQYPPLGSFSFVDYFKWLTQNQLFFDQENASPYKRALNNFSHLIERPELLKTVALQAMTLELLYCDSNIGITDQLNRKIQTYLGELTGFKKQIKEMYKLRSSLLHGDVPIKPSHRGFVNIKEQVLIGDQKLANEATSLGMLLVVSTLQLMYLQDRVELKFDYKLKD